jgi:hypothetical protein
MSGKGTVKLVSGAAKADDLGVDTQPEGPSCARCRNGTIRQWCAKFGPVYADGLRRRQPRPGDKWHLDEVFLTITAVVTTCGGPSTRTAMSSTFSSNLAGMPRPPSGSSVNC